MKASVIHEYGGPEILKYEDYPDPVLQPGEVLVRVAAAGVNPVDALERSGETKQWRPIQFPGVLGWDLSGTVEKLGPGANGFSVGDQVLAWAYHTYAERCAVKAELLAKVPRDMNLVDAAALPLVTMTGSQLIFAADVKAGQTVLVSGAAGGVGRSAVFAAKDRDAVVIAGLRKNQLDGAKNVGADQIIALDDPASFGELQQVDIVANTVRGKTAEDLLAKVKPGGTFASVTGVPSNVGHYPRVRAIAFVSKQDTKNLEYTVGAVRAGKLTITIGTRLPLRKAAEAHLALAKGGAGKILLLP
jgi:NADPH:quinone reductase-like Zn-dependent oxidoreductase